MAVQIACDFYHVLAGLDARISPLNIPFSATMISAIPAEINKALSDDAAQEGMKMYNQLKRIHQRPEIFSAYTADVLWTQPHLAAKMLQTHLNQETPLASRPVVAIDRVVTWLDDEFHLNGKAVCDLGCGPGLYAERYAQRGAIVCGLDFSTNSIEYAKKSASKNNVSASYAVANYLTDPIPLQQDLITMIYCDLCPLSPAKRRILLGKIRKSLRQDGAFVFDVASIKAFENIVEKTAFEHNYMDGFWSEDDYFVFHNTYRYENQSVSLDHFSVIEEKGIWSVYNWMQYYTSRSIEAELKENGFELTDIVSGFGTNEADETTFGVIARPSK